jgi:hypothetical protein
MGIVAERTKVRSEIILHVQKFNWIFFRKEPPTEEELKKNLAIMYMKKKNAALLDEKYGKPQDHASLKKNEISGRAEFPRYDEDYEIMPGSKPIKK